MTIKRSTGIIAALVLATLLGLGGRFLLERGDGQALSQAGDPPPTPTAILDSATPDIQFAGGDPPPLPPGAPPDLLSRPPEEWLIWKTPRDELEASLPPDILREMDALYPDYAYDGSVTGLGATPETSGTFYCRAAGAVNTDANGYVTKVYAGDTSWVGRPVHRAQEVAMGERRPDFASADLSRGLAENSFSVAVYFDQDGNLVGGGALCRKLPDVLWNDPYHGAGN